MAARGMARRKYRAHRGIKKKKKRAANSHQQRDSGQRRHEAQRENNEINVAWRNINGEEA